MHKTKYMCIKSINLLEYYFFCSLDILMFILIKYHQLVSNAVTPIYTFTSRI